MKLHLSLIAAVVLTIVSTAHATKRLEPPYSYSSLAGEMVRLFPLGESVFRPTGLVAQITGSPAHPRKAFFIEYRNIWKGRNSYSGQDVYRDVKTIWAVNLDDEIQLAERVALETNDQNPLAEVYQLVVHPNNSDALLAVVRESERESSLWSFQINDPKDTLTKIMTFGSYNQYDNQPIEFLEDMPGNILLPASNGYGMKRISIGTSTPNSSPAVNFGASDRGSSYVTDFTDLPGTGLGVYITGNSDELVVFDLKHPNETPKTHKLPERMEEIQNVPGYPGTALMTAGYYSQNVYELKITKSTLSLQVIGKQKYHQVPQFWHDGRVILQKQGGAYVQTYKQYLNSMGGN